MQLVIVESPTKAKTITRFLGNDFKVVSSYGHVRDLPKSKLGIDVENNFQPQYITPRQKQKQITQLKKQAQQADQVWFATDEDREGEAISWHLQKLFKIDKDKTGRIVFHEITPEAIQEALKNPRSIDINLVNAQQARRILDRLVGYKLSPLLWKKIVKGLSAGRVQSPALRLIVEREEVIGKFNPQEYWSLEAEFKDQSNNNFIAQLNQIEKKTLKKLDLKDKPTIDKIVKNLEKTNFQIVNLQQQDKIKNALPPFTTSTLQQTAINRFGFSAKQTMVIAQQLYEGIDLKNKGTVGLITYMRTDSTNLADKFLNQAQKYIQDNLGSQYYPGKSRRFKTKSKSAQEAHEAIRPTNVDLVPEEIKQSLDKNQFKLYQLIWQRAVACQMSAAKIQATQIDIQDKTQKYIFRANGSVIKFDGFLKIYPTKTQENILPELKKGQEVDLIKFDPQQHFTQPPARFTEASLVKTLEKFGIGRPSTYAQIISTLQQRNYVNKEKRYLIPTEIGSLVNKVLVEHFNQIVDYDFTARMENELDDIAQGKLDWTKAIKDFYQPFIKNIKDKEETLSKEKITQQEKTDKKCPKCNSPMIIKLGRFGKFLACSNYPECKTTQPLDDQEQQTETTKEKCPECGHELKIKFGRYGKFLACSNYPECKFTKPIFKPTGVKCPDCGQGELVEKKTKKGRPFYSCSKYPICKFAVWSKPVNEKCPKCSSLLVYGPKDTLCCSNKECNFTKPQPE